ncbi:MAG: glycosyl transferase family protein [Burkholderiales bacterium]|nr:glycosyl transferase family protein [Burkholderiales bacterium]
MSEPLAASGRLPDIGEHPFAQYIRIVGRGRHGSRAMTYDEACAAMRMIMAGACEREQVGAFFMLIRVREETAEELAGFVAAVRETIQVPGGAPRVRIDWPSYAGKRRHLPWFLLAALLVARNGFPVLMHGIARAGDGRIYTRDALARLGLPVSGSLAEAVEEIRKGGFAYVPLDAFAPQVARIIGLRALLGLRSPANSIARMLNPLDAPVQLVGIFHPNYRDVHQRAATRLGQPHMAVLRGEGGEAERNPDVSCLVQSACDGQERSEEWPAMFAGGRHLKDTTLEIGRLAAVWRGDAVDEYGAAAVVGTAAIALKALGVAGNIPDAERAARRLWDERPKSLLRAA